MKTIFAFIFRAADLLAFSAVDRTISAHVQITENSLETLFDSIFLIVRRIDR